MQLNLISFNDTAFSPNFTGYVLHPKPLRLGAAAEFQEVSGSFAEYTGKSFGGGYLTIQVVYEGDLADVHDREFELTRLFNTMDETPYKLLAEDSADADRQWYVMATPLDIAQENNSAIIVLALEEPFWQVETPSTDSWAITTSPETQDVDCIGEHADPIFEITPTSAKSLGYLYYRFVEILPGSTTKVMPNHPFLITTLDTAALVSGGKAQSGGEDFRFVLGGAEYPIHFGTGAAAFNQTGTKIWTGLDIPLRVTLTLKTAIASSGDISQIEFEQTIANKLALQKLPARGILKIVTSGSYEYFTYTRKINNAFKVTGVKRKAKLSSEIAHTAGDTVYWIPFDAWFVYGNSVVSAPDYDNTKKPILDLENSTNTSWVYTEFMEDGVSRPGAWQKSAISTLLKKSFPYTGSHGVNVSPATEAGLKMATKAINGLEKAETATNLWTLYCPVGITDIASMTLDKYRQTTGFPTVTIEKSLDGITYNVAQTLTTPGSAATWTGQTITALSLSGTFPNLQFKQTGTLAAYSGNKALAEIQGCTLTLNSAYDPNAIVRSEQNTYYLEAKISNTTTGDAFYITLAMKLNDVLTINCVERSVTLQDGTRMQAAIRLDSDRVDWLRFAFGTNTLEFEDDGTLGITVDTTWSDKVAV